MDLSGANDKGIDQHVKELGDESDKEAAIVALATQFEEELLSNVKIFQDGCETLMKDADLVDIQILFTRYRGKNDRLLGKAFRQALASGSLNIAKSELDNA